MTAPVDAPAGEPFHSAPRTLTFTIPAGYHLGSIRPGGHYRQSFRDYAAVWSAWLTTPDHTWHGTGMGPGPQEAINAAQADLEANRAAFRTRFPPQAAPAPARSAQALTLDDLFGA